MVLTNISVYGEKQQEPSVSALKSSGQRNGERTTGIKTSYLRWSLSTLRQAVCFLAAPWYTQYFGKDARQVNVTLLSMLHNILTFFTAWLDSS